MTRFMTEKRILKMNEASGTKTGSFLFFRIIRKERKMTEQNLMREKESDTGLLFQVPLGIIAGCLDACTEEDWEQLTFILTESNSAPYLGWLFPAFFPSVPDSEKYNLALQVYSNHGDGYDCVREAVKEIRKYGSPELPSELDDLIHIYRAGYEDISEAPYSLSWTTDKAMAEKFVVMQSMKNDKPSALYEGWIRKEQILAYTNDRNESEIIQYGSVMDVREIPVSRLIIKDMILYNLGTRPCWPKVAATIGKLEREFLSGYRVVENPPEDLRKICDSLGEGFQVMRDEHGSISIEYDLGMDWHFDIYPEDDLLLLHVGWGGNHKYASMTEPEYLQTEVAWILKEYSHRKIRLRHKRGQRKVKKYGKII